MADLQGVPKAKMQNLLWRCEAICAGRNLRDVCEGKTDEIAKAIDSVYLKSHWPRENREERRVNSFF
jgi:hypothetical protein